MTKITFNDFTFQPRPGLSDGGSGREPLKPVTHADENTITTYLDIIQKQFPGQLAFSLDQVAALLNVDYETVRRRVEDGRIYSIPFGRRLLIPLHELARIISQGVK